MHKRHCAPPDRRTSITGAAVAFDQKRRQATASGTISARAPLRASRQEDEHPWRGSSLRSEAPTSHREQHDQCTSTIARLQTGGRASLARRQTSIGGADRPPRAARSVHERHRAPPDKKTSIAGAAAVFDQKGCWHTTASSTISARALLRASRQEGEHHWRGSSLRPEAPTSHRERHGQCTSTIARLQTGGRASLARQ